MNKLIKSTTAITSTIVLAVAMLLATGGVAQAASCYQYNGNGFQTSKTPVFNDVCGVPGYGDERDFVRVRPSSGDPLSTSNNSAYVNNLASTCTDGAKYDVHTYIHNDAEPSLNNNGSGSAVAHNVQLAMTAPLGSIGQQFVFGSKITASNAASVSDTATINCNGEAVKLSLVPSTVHIYGSGGAYPWTSLPDSAVNGTTKLGNPHFGSGDVYGCWQYRIAVVYQVVVKKVPKPKPSTGICKQVDLDVAKDRSVNVAVHGETNNATIIGYKIDFGDGTVVNSQNATHTYKKAGSYTIVGYVNIRYSSGETEWKTADACRGEVTVTTPKKPPVITTQTTTTPKSAPTPSSLPSTGPAGIASLFAGTTGFGAISHWFYRRRKYGRQ